MNNKKFIVLITALGLFSNAFGKTLKPGDEGYNPYLNPEGFFSEEEEEILVPPSQAPQEKASMPSQEVMAKEKAVAKKMPTANEARKTGWTKELTKRRKPTPQEKALVSAQEMAEEGPVTKKMPTEVVTTEEEEVMTSGPSSSSMGQEETTKKPTTISKKVGRRDLWIQQSLKSE